MTEERNGIIYPFVDENHFQYGVENWIQWDMAKDGYRILLSGPSGSGKTTLAQGLLSRIARHLHGCEIYVLDYKNIDFAYLDGAKRYFVFDDTTDGFLEFYSIFEDRLRRNDEFPWLVLYIDEYPSWIGSMPNCFKLLGICMKITPCPTMSQTLILNYSARRCFSTDRVGKVSNLGTKLRNCPNRGGLAVPPGRKAAGFFPVHMLKLYFTV